MEYGLVMSPFYQTLEDNDNRCCQSKTDKNSNKETELVKQHKTTISCLSSLETKNSSLDHCPKWKELKKEYSRVSRRMYNSIRKHIPRGLSTLHQWHYYFRALILKDQLPKQPLFGIRKDLLMNLLLSRHSGSSVPNNSSKPALCPSAQEDNHSNFEPNNNFIPLPDANSLADEYLALNCVHTDSNTSSTTNMSQLIDSHLKFNDKLLTYLISSDNNLSTGEERLLKEILHLSWRKTTALQEHLDFSPVVSDLQRFAKVITDLLSDFRDSQRKSGISTTSKHYFDKMEEKIMETKQCIRDHVVVVADQVEKQLAVVETTALNEFDGYSDAAKIKAMFRWLVVILKAVGALADLCTPFGVGGPGKSLKVGVTAIAVLVSVIDPTVENPKAFQSNFVDNQNMMLQDTQSVLERQIGILQKAIKSSDQLENLQNHLDEMEKINEVIKKDDLPEEKRRFFLRKLDAVRDANYAEMHSIKLSLSQDEKTCSILDALYLQMVMAEKESILYSHYRSQWGEVFARIFKASKEHKRHITERTESFSQKFAPMMEKLVSLTKSHVEDVAGESAAKMIISEWKLETILKGVKRHLESLVKGMRVEIFLASSINRLLLAIQKHLELLQLIRQYEELILQAEFIEGVLVPEEESGIGSAFKNRKLKAKRDKAEMQTNMSLMLLEVDKCIYSFNMLVFPSAYQYLQDIKSQRQKILKVSQNTDSRKVGEMGEKCVRLVNSVQRKLSKHFCEIRREDAYWKRAYFSNDYKSTGAFYTWTNKNYAFEIGQLLLGSTVTLIADVSQCPKYKGAVKYNGSLKSRIVHEMREDEMLQRELYRYLRHFSVSFESGETCQYKLFESTYTVHMGKGLAYVHSLETCKEDMKASVGENMVLHKLEEYMFSPFTIWKVKLKKCSNQISFQEFHEKFASRVNLELEGWGMFIDEESADQKDFDKTIEVYSDWLSDEH